MRILLWDIDGTLVRSSGAGARALARAVSAHPQAVETLRGMRLDGMTDFKIARALCAANRHAGDPSLALDAHFPLVGDDEIRAVLDAYLNVLEEVLAATEGYDFQPGVLEVLGALDTRGGTLHALGTGNLERGARLKLQRGNLWERFAFGGFGSDAEERADILRAAWRKAEAHQGCTLVAQDFVVIGDTPRDISAAHEVGMACVGVGTGRFSVAELMDHGADDALENLSVADAAHRIATARRR